MFIGFLHCFKPRRSCAFSSLSSRAQDTEYLIEAGRTHFSDFFKFPLDEWQLRAGGAICNGYNVIVSAPTGAGKTVVGEMALHWARSKQKQGIYTTPLKALSNEKFLDFCSLFGRNETGLSTGDLSINKAAGVRVMTTEVYRNIAWRSTDNDPSDAVHSAVVVLDELHYLGLQGRGSTWEESIILASPLRTQLIGLSATLSNGQDLSDWITSVSDRETVLIEVPSSMRPVPLRFKFATKAGLGPLFRDPDAGPGAPNGLLGYREDDDSITAPDQQKRGERGFGKNRKNVQDQVKIPRGLRPNPALASDAAKRLRRVERALDRQKAAMKLQRGNSYRDDDLESSFRRMPRKLSPRHEQRERERLLKKELRASVPSMHAVVERLNHKQLLPGMCS